MPALIGHALYVSTGNAREVVGQSPRWVRDFVRRKNLPLLHIGSKWFVRADALADAMEADGAGTQPPEPGGKHAELARLLEAP